MEDRMDKKPPMLPDVKSDASPDNDQPDTPNTNHEVYNTANKNVLLACNWISLKYFPILVSRNRYNDQHIAPARQKMSPTFKAAAELVAAAAAVKNAAAAGGGSNLDIGILFPAEKKDPLRWERASERAHSFSSSSLDVLQCN